MKHLFSLDQEEAYACKLEVSVWNYSHSGKHECLGEDEKYNSFPSVIARPEIYWVGKWVATKFL